MYLQYIYVILIFLSYEVYMFSCILKTSIQY
jgi:hypothetical protein